ncbi:bone morphogenetic protein 3-like [Anneissia japonica]|uniref:bone morphogenetic protein 3-like n=1 Tax=Anneissia japonica TaxID=1529436 RepID=UPI00142580AB|nr:bone morphogenetic protein 3-like [Anneissia japonica]
MMNVKVWAVFLLMTIVADAELTELQEILSGKPAVSSKPDDLFASLQANPASRDPVGRLRKNKSNLKPHRYILRILEPLVKNDTALEKGSTVYSFAAEKKSTCGEKHMFVLKLKPKSEKKNIIKAELYVNNRKPLQPSQFNNTGMSELVIVVYDVQNPNQCLKVGTFGIDDFEGDGWQKIDIKTILSQLSEGLTKRAVLGVSFKIRNRKSDENNEIDHKNDWWDRLMSKKKMLQKRGRPFILVHVEDTAVDADLTSMPFQRLSDTMKSTINSRQRRSVILPEPKPINESDHYIYLMTNEYPPAPPVEVVPSPEVKFPAFLDQNSRRRKERKHTKRRKNRRKNGVIPFGQETTKPLTPLSNKADEIVHLQKPENEDYKNTEGLCSLRKLSVNFKDLGWESFVIAPELFTPNYCAGSCPYPLQKSLNPTNNALILSMVKSMGVQVPAPCCVPTKMSSISILYLDEEMNVLLRNYPNMQVESCGCM